METTFDRTQILLESLDTVGYDVAEEYGEPGYSLPEGGKGIIFSNWNTIRERGQKEDGTWGLTGKEDDTPERVGKLLERLGWDTEWSDEWTTCDCGKAVRTSPDSYSWLPSFVLGNGEILCKDCALEDPGDYVSGYLLNSTSKADTFGIDLSGLGFRKLEDESRESGWHEGQTDDPEKVAELVPEGQDYVFQLDEQSQFYCRWSCWIRPDDAQGES